MLRPGRGALRLPPGRRALHRRPALSATPAAGLLDQQVTVRASGLPPGATVTLATELRRDEERIHFTSTSKFVTSGEGLLDTGRQAPLEGGSYHGTHRSGALWSVRPEPGSVSRLWPEDITRRLHYSLALRDPAGHTLCRAQVWRGYTAPGVRRVEVREAGLVGTLFLPETAGPAPAIITLYGGVNRGRVPEDRAALLASRGFVTLALAFFGVDGLPEVYNDIEVEYFEAAIRWLVARPEVAGSSVGLCGISKGGDASLALAQFLGPLVAAVSLQGASYVTAPGVTRYKKEVVQPTEFTWADDLADWDGSPRALPIGIKGGVEELIRHPDRQILFERSAAPVLGMVGEEDSRDLINIARFNFARAGRAGKLNCRLVELAGAGHLVDLPHSPLCSEARHPMLPRGVTVRYGGRPQPHALAQFTAWSLLLGFFRKHLRP